MNYNALPLVIELCNSIHNPSFPCHFLNLRKVAYIMHHALLLQVLAYAQQSRERSNYEQAALLERMQEFKRQIDRESRWSPNGMNDSPNGDGIQAIGRSSHKMIEAAMQSASKGKVTHCRYLMTVFTHSWLWYFIKEDACFILKSNKLFSGSDHPSRLPL